MGGDKWQITSVLFEAQANVDETLEVASQRRTYGDNEAVEITHWPLSPT